MEEKQLTPYILKRLSNMSFDEKVRLYARLRLLKQNKQISGIISKTVGFETFNSLKAEITHHLYDGNDNYVNADKYHEMLDAMINNKNIFTMFDAYTMCMYMLFFDKFIEYAKDARYTDHIRYAKEKALDYIKSNTYFDRQLLNMDYDEKGAGMSTLLKPEYRRSIVKYLTQDLKIKNGFDFVQKYVNDELDIDYEDIIPQTDPNKVYANTVEEYRDANGRVYYIDADGNTYDSSEIADFDYNGYSLSATKNGFVAKSKTKDNDYEM